MPILKWEVTFQDFPKVWEVLVTWVVSQWEEWVATDKPLHLK